MFFNVNIGAVEWELSENGLPPTFDRSSPWHIAAVQSIWSETSKTMPRA
jgi:hypothetical protein